MVLTVPVVPLLPFIIMESLLLVVKLLMFLINVYRKLLFLSLHAILALSPRTITKIDMIVLAQVWILEVVVVEMAVLRNVFEESALVEVDLVESEQGVVDVVVFRVGTDLAEDVELV